jgi:hypothetical protein
MILVKAMSQATLTDVSLDPILERLTQLAQLEPDWDSYGALPVSAVAFVKACQLLIDVKYSLSPLVGEGILPSDAAPIADGSLQLEWRGPHGKLEVEIKPDMNFSYLLIKGEGSERKFEEKNQVSLSEVLNVVSQVLIP